MPKLEYKIFSNFIIYKCNKEQEKAIKFTE